MTRDDALQVRAGDMIEPISAWNRSERIRKLASPTRVLKVSHSHVSQTGVMFMIQFENGKTSWLDAGWFKAAGG